MSEERREYDLGDDVDWPFRPAPSRTRLCGTCVHCQDVVGEEGEVPDEYVGLLLDFHCDLGLEMTGPLMVTTNDCPRWEFQPRPWDERPGKVFRFALAEDAGDSPWAVHRHVDQFPECQECGNFHRGRCEAVGWVPFRRKPRCEFFVEKSKTCRHAVPCLQYSGHHRNNFCSLDPSLRDPGWRSPPADWQRMCPDAHRHPDLKCYEPIGGE